MLVKVVVRWVRDGRKMESVRALTRVPCVGEIMTIGPRGPKRVHMVVHEGHVPETVMTKHHIAAIVYCAECGATDYDWDSAARDGANPPSPGS